MNSTAQLFQSHDWIYHAGTISGKKVVHCRRCGKWDSYRLVGYKPEPPEGECRPKPRRFTVIDHDSGVAYSIGDDGRRAL